MTSGIELWDWHELVMNGSLGAAQKDATPRSDERDERRRAHSAAPLA
jgi:hypothetical protein